MAKLRQSNFELLRIIAMLAIVYGHFASHGSWEGITFPETVFLNEIAIGGSLAVNIFVMITGLFTASSSFRMRSLLKVMLPTIFWCLTLGTLFLTVFYGAYPVQLILHVPWFVVAFILMFLFIPWMNYLATHISKKSYTILLLLGFVLLSVVSSITGSSFINSTVLWFLYLYMVGGFVGIHGVGIRTSLLVMLFIVVAALHTIAVAMPLLEGVEPGLITVNGVWTSRNSVTVFLMAFLAIVLFERIDIGSRPLLNRIASASFGVYLISDNPFVRAWLWPQITQFVSTSFFSIAIGGVVAALCIYAICTCMELARAAISKRITEMLPGSGLMPFCLFVDKHYAQVSGDDDA